MYAAANLKRYQALFGLPPPAEASLLYGEEGSGGGPITGRALATPARRARHNLPAAPTKFIGREAEVAEVMELLGRNEVRLLTLTGPGGTGKTRLALEAARALVDHFPGGVTFVDLAAISDPGLVAATAAQAIGIREGGGRPPLENLKDYLADKQALLLFDNFEQVAGVAPAIAELLAAAPGVKALVTSRVSLQVRGEHEYPVRPLETPPDLDGPRLPEETMAYEAVALFRQQARAARPQFEITAENSAAVIEICRRLDGLPLAIEMAAARVKMLPPPALLKRLDQSLNVLVGGAADLPDRQRTLRRTIDWSFNLLSEEEQALFTRLSAFAGGFTLEAAEAVCNPRGEIDVFAGIETLLNSSLLRPVRSVTDEPRFDMLQTIRDYALEQAEEAGLTAELRAAHGNYFARLVAHDMGQGIFSADSVLWLRRFDEERDNFRLTLAWAIGEMEAVHAPLAVGIMFQMSWYWYRYGHLQEGREWTTRALEATAGMAGSPIRMWALAGRGFLAMWSGELNVAAEYAWKAMELAERLRMDDGLAAEMGRERWAVPLLSAADRELRAIGGQWWPADRVEIERARELMETALAEAFDALWEQGQGMDSREAMAYAAAWE